MKDKNPGCVAICVVATIILFLILLPLVGAARNAAKEQHRPTLTWVERRQLEDQELKLNVEILESKARIWRKIENDPSLITPEMVRALRNE